MTRQLGGHVSWKCVNRIVTWVAEKGLHFLPRPPIPLSPDPDSAGCQSPGVPNRRAGGPGSSGGGGQEGEGRDPPAVGGGGLLSKDHQASCTQFRWPGTQGHCHLPSSGLHPRSCDCHVTVMRCQVRGVETRMQAPDPSQEPHSIRVLIQR